MLTRKIQLIAGTTYSVSLPKDWVKKNNLKEKSSVRIYEKSDRTLVVSPHSVEQKKLTEITLNIDNHLNNIDQILFAVYYVGIENITLFSNKILAKEVKARIRKTIAHMSGTEISFEDQQKITVRVLLDKSKVDIHQTLYRISLIIESSIQGILEQLDIDEIRFNENEIDRLYHLLAKIISVSLINSNVLHTSNMKNVSLIPSYFMISKRLENIADNIYLLAEHMNKNKSIFENRKIVLGFIKSEINRSITYFISKSTKPFEKIKHEDLTDINNTISKLKDKTILNNMLEVTRYILDVEEEIVNISFYNHLINENLL